MGARLEVTMGTQEEFQEAYRKWRAARDAYDETMRQAMEGVPMSWPEMLEQIKEMDRLHAVWREKSIPFVHWKRA